MGKSKEEEVNPFADFNLIKGQFVPPKADIPAVDKTGDVVEDGDIDDVEAAKQAEIDKKLAEAEEAARKIKESKNKKADEPEVVEDSEDEGQEDEGDESPFKVFTKTLAEKGVLDFDDTDEDFEDSEDGLNKLVNKTVENRINKWVGSLDQEYLDFLNYVQAGGKARDFAKVYYSDYSWSDFDIDSEDSQKLAVRESLKLAGEEPEDIEDMIEEWSDNGTLAKRAATAKKKLEKHEAIEKENLVKRQAEAAEQRRLAEEQEWNNFKKNVYSKDEINGFKVTKKQKDDLWNFLSTTDKKTGKTPYQKAIEENQDAQLLFAYIAMNGFDITKLESQVKTKVSKDLGKIFKNHVTNSRDKMSSGSDNDHFSTGAFDGFRQSKA